MNILTTIAHTLLRITGLIQIVLGLLFWTGTALNLLVGLAAIGIGVGLARRIRNVASTTIGVPDHG